MQEADRSLSDWLAIPRSIKTTCIKPSGTGESEGVFAAID